MRRKVFFFELLNSHFRDLSLLLSLDDLHALWHLALDAHFCALLLAQRVIPLARFELLHHRLYILDRLVDRHCWALKLEVD